MCGFAFLTSTRPLSNDLKNLFKDASQRFISTRGPTSQNLDSDEYSISYQSILSIQSRPSTSHSDTSFLYNGEIFTWPSSLSSYISPTDSDTTNLIRLRKHGLLQQALVEADSMHAVCSISRDPTSRISAINIYRDFPGEKHVWYYHDSTYFIVSSVPGFIATVLSSLTTLFPDPQVIADYFLRRHLISPLHHPITGIRQVLPGQHLHLNCRTWLLQSELISTFHNLFDADIYHTSLSRPAAITGLVGSTLSNVISAMESTCRDHVTSACVFSGGIDSSLVSSYLLSSSRHPSTNLFTLTFGSKDPVSLLASSFLSNIPNERIVHEVLTCTPDLYISALTESIQVLASPINTHSIPSALLVSNATARSSNQVLYGGEGADELFLGYRTYIDHNQSIYTNVVHNYPSSHLTSLSINSGIPAYIESLRISISTHLESCHVLPQHINVITQSMLDFFIQLPSVGLLSSDTIQSHSGIEARTPFLRDAMIRLGISLNPDSRTAFSSIPKAPLAQLFLEKFRLTNVPPKMGFSGYPNEAKSLLPKSDWRVFDLLKLSHSAFLDADRALAWKVINTELFLQTLFP